MMDSRLTRFNTLLSRECYRFLRLFRQTIFPPIITTLLFIFVFGFSLGSRIREIEGFTYIIYILPGLAAMGAITNSYSNSSTSLFMSRMDLSIENLIASPLSNFQLVSAFVLGSLLRGLTVGVLTILVAIPLIDLPVSHWPLMLLAMSLTSVFFGCLGIISALWSEGWDQIATFTNFVITPFVYLGGVFYSIDMLPPFWKKVSLFNPIFYMVDAIRLSVLGTSDLSWWVSFGILGAMTLVSYLTCVYLFRIGYKLVQ